MDVLNLRGHEGIVCNNPEEIEKIKILILEKTGWDCKHLIDRKRKIILYPYDYSWNNINQRNVKGYIHYEAKLFLNKNNYETWRY